MSLPWMKVAQKAAEDMNGGVALIPQPLSTTAVVPANGAGVGLGATDLKALPSAKRTAKNLDRMSRLHVLEKAMIIAAAHRLAPTRIEELKTCLEERDKTKEGCISVHL